MRIRRQWNLDIIGVTGIEAEAELLAALVTFFKAAGLGPQDVGIKVRSDGYRNFVRLSGVRMIDAADAIAQLLAVAE